MEGWHGSHDHPYQPHQPGADGDRHRQQVQGERQHRTAPNASDAAEKVKKLKLAVKYGADTVMISPPVASTSMSAPAIINAHRAIGTVPVYQALESVHSSIEKLDEDDFLHHREALPAGCRLPDHPCWSADRAPKVKGRIANRQPWRRDSGSVDAVSPPSEPATPVLTTSARSSSVMTAPSSAIPCVRTPTTSDAAQLAGCTPWVS